MSARIFRYEVPVDDQWHEFEVRPTVRCALRVVGTGQPLPDGDWRYVGTAVAPSRVLVWHLLERTS